MVDGVFSMDGDSAPLAELARICRDQGAGLMVDDAHGFGVMGHSGAGSLEAASLDQEDVPILMATLGKALGTAGAFVAGSELLIEGLIQQARNYIYTTAQPPAVAVATLVALRLLQEEAWRRDHLAALVSRFRAGAEQLGVPMAAAGSAIQPLMIGDVGRALALSARLRERGLLIGAIGWRDTFLVAQKSGANAVGITALATLIVLAVAGRLGLRSTSRAFSSAAGGRPSASNAASTSRSAAIARMREARASALS